MKKIPSNVPVFIQNLESEENGRYSTAKLKVFYQGETGDHRLFTKKFSESLIETLPSTPVVGFYSEEDEDFLGHNVTQYVYGHVPETASIEFVTDDDGVAWAMTDVILYTKRKDNIGDVAKKIVGKQHSLELDPDTIKYKINRDNNGKFLNIEFLDGQFIGLSVLGDNETPAFSGSGFFTTNEDFKQFAATCHQNFDKFLDYLNKSGGEIQVFNSEEFFSKAGEFLAKTMQEFQADIYAALERMGIYGWIMENTDTYAVVYHYNQEFDKCDNYKYTIEYDENGQMSLTNPTPVRARFLTDEQMEKLDFTLQDCAAKEDEESKCAEKEEENKKAPESEEDEEAFVLTSAKEDENKEDQEDEPKPDDKDDDEFVKSDEDKKSKCASDAKEEERGEKDDTKTQQEEEEEDDKQVGTATASVSVTTLSDEERSELEGYRKSEKLALIATYAADLDKTILDTYIATVDSYSKSELEAKLAIEYRNYMLTKPQDVAKNVTTYSMIATAPSYHEDNSADVINKYSK